MRHNPTLEVGERVEHVDPAARGDHPTGEVVDKGAGLIRVQPDDPGRCTWLVDLYEVQRVRPE